MILFISLVPIFHLIKIKEVGINLTRVAVESSSRNGTVQKGRESRE
jgi:hypothetical protein